MKHYYQYILAFLVICFPAISMAAAPMTPAGLCIQMPDGTTQCAGPAIITNPNIVAPQKVIPANFHPGYYIKGGTSDNNHPTADFVFRRIESYSDIFVGHRQGYRWKTLEPSKGVYDFSIIEADLQRLESIGKRLVIDIVHKGNSSTPGTPTYMWHDPTYGCDRRFYGSYESGKAGSNWVLCFWNKNVQKRFTALVTALGKRFNNEPYFEGTTLTETSQTRPADPAAMGFSSEGLEQAFKAMAFASKVAFPDKMVIQHINFAPYDLASFAAWLANNGIGIGSPDIRLTNSTLNNVTYPLYLKYHDIVATAPDVQWDNYETNSVAADDSNIAETLLKGAIARTNPYYMFWVARTPYFTDDVIPTLRKYGPLPAAKAFYGSINNP